MKDLMTRFRRPKKIRRSNDEMSRRRNYPDLRFFLIGRFVDDDPDVAPDFQLIGHADRAKCGFVGSDPEIGLQNGEIAAQSSDLAILKLGLGANRDGAGCSVQSEISPAIIYTGSPPVTVRSLCRLDL